MWRVVADRPAGCYGGDAAADRINGRCRSRIPGVASCAMNRRSIRLTGARLLNESHSPQPPLVFFVAALEPSAVHTRKEAVPGVLAVIVFGAFDARPGHFYVCFDE